MASHTSPGATRSSTSLESRANPNITIVTPANGRIWLATTRLWRSIRRSLAAISRIDAAGASRRGSADLAGDDVDASASPASRRVRARGWPRRSSPRTRPPDGARHRARRGRRRRARRAARRAATARPRRATTHASAVRRRWPADNVRTRTSASRPASPSRSSAARDLAGRCADRRAPEPDVLGDRQVGVEAVRVAEQADPRAHRVAFGRQVEPEHPAAATHDREQAGAEPQ